MNEQDKMRSHGKIIAGTIIIAMLLCSCIPAITVWNDGFELSADTEGEEQNGTFNYVSLGDSMVNGFGTAAYYPAEGVNANGFNVKNVVGTYPYRIASYLASEDVFGPGNVDWKQLGISATRSAELRYILDKTFEGDDYTQNLISTEDGQNVLNSLTSLDYPATIDGLRDYFKKCIEDADLVSYQFHYDFGYTLTNIIMDTVKGNEVSDLSFDVYLDQEFIDLFNETYEKIKVFIIDKLNEQGKDIGPYTDVIKFAEGIAKGLAYAAISYCSNFDANMKTIFTWNKDVRILVLDSYNTFDGRYMVYEDYQIPLGGIYQILLDIVNLYTKWLSPYSMFVYHVDIDEIPQLMTDEITKEGADKANILSDTKDVIISIINGRIVDPVDGASVVSNKIGDVECTYLYEQYDADGNLTKLLSPVLSSKYLDWAYFTEGDFNTKSAEAVMKFFTAIGYIVGANVDNDPLSITIINEVDEGYLIQLKYNGISVNGKEDIYLDKNEMVMAWMDVYLFEIRSAASHPTVSGSNSGHAYIFNQVVDVIESRNVLTEDRSEYINKITGIIDSVKDVIDGPYDPEYVMTLGMDDVSSHTLVSICDQSASMDESYYPAILAHRLGLDLDSLAIPSGARVDDINYLVGGMNERDAYSWMLLGDDPSRQEIQSSIADADVVVLQAGVYNVLFPAINTIFNYSVDPTQFDIVDVEFYKDVKKLVGHIEGVVTKIFGDEVVPTINKVNTIVESSVYSFAGFIQYYPETVAEIYSLNPDAEIIILGINNFLDGFYVPIDDEWDVDLGFFGQFIAGAMNHALEYIIPEADNIHFVDISDIESKAASYGEIDLKDAIQGCEGIIDVMEILDLCAPSEAGQQQIASAIEEIFFDKTYTITYNVGIEGVNPVDIEVNYGSVIQDYVPELPAGYWFDGWLPGVPDTMPAKDIELTANIQITDMKLTIDINDDGSITVTIIGLNGTFADGSLQVSYAYGYKEDGVFKTGTVRCDAMTVLNLDGKTYAEVVTSFTGEDRTIQSVWATYNTDNATVSTPHILYQIAEVST